MLTSLLTPILPLLNKLIPDQTAKQQQLTQVILADKQNAQFDRHHKSIFVSGARPFIRWTIGFILLYEIIIIPIAGTFGYIIPGINIPEFLTAAIGYV